MYLGINLSHGSSACLIDSQGHLISAIEEERISRVKNHYGIPKLSIEYLANEIANKFEIQKIVHGSFSILDKDSFSRILANDGDSPSNPLGSWKCLDPDGKHPPAKHIQLLKTKLTKS